MRVSSWIAGSHILTITSHDREKERANTLVSLLIKSLIPSNRGPGLMTSSNLNYPPKVPFEYHHTGAWASTYESSGKDKNI